MLDWSKASLTEMRELARRDDVFDGMVPSDLRVVLMRYAEAVEALKTFSVHYPMGINPYLDSAYRAALPAIAKAEGKQP